MAPMQWSWRNAPKPLTDVSDETAPSSLSRRLTIVWLLGILVLLPINFVRLPFNMDLVDCWILLALPVWWVSFVRGSHVMNMSYAIAMWFILVASFASTIAAPSPTNSLIVILKEIYLYVWFVTLTAVLVTLSARDFRRLLIVWSGIVFLHGLVIVAQFLSPTFWQFTTSLTGRSSDYEIYRTSGLFMNANSAAFYQLLGFVPFVLARPSKKTAMILTIFLLPAVLATGSMGAVVAFIAGLAVAIIAIFLTGRLGLIIKMFMQMAIVLSLLGALLYFIVSHNARYQAHFEHIFLGRAEKSSGSRFDLWQRGFDAFLDHNVLLWGVGPENFREVDEHRSDNQLHNDFLAFLVERGLLGVLGLGLFTALAAGRAIHIVLIGHKYPDRAQLTVVVFLAAIAAIIVESFTHQIFHFRALWLVLALQEAMLFKIMTADGGLEPTTSALNGPPQDLPGFVTRPDVTSG